MGAYGCYHGPSSQNQPYLGGLLSIFHLNESQIPKPHKGGLGIQKLSSFNQVLSGK